MGGVLARELVLNHLDTSLLRGVVFIGCPLKGSTMRQEVKAEIGPSMIAFLNNCFEGIDSQEYTENFYEGFKDSIPYKVITESKKTFLPVVGKSFWFV